MHELYSISCDHKNTNKRTHKHRLLTILQRHMHHKWEMKELKTKKNKSKHNEISREKKTLHQVWVAVCKLYRIPFMLAIVTFFFRFNLFGCFFFCICARFLIDKHAVRKQPTFIVNLLHIYSYFCLNAVLCVCVCVWLNQFMGWIVLKCPIQCVLPIN